MIEWFTHFLLYLASKIASLFVSPTSLKFSVISMVIAVLIFSASVLIIAFWPQLVAWLKRLNKK